MRNFLVDNTRDLMIFLDDRSLSDRYFRAMIALETTLSKEDSSRHTSHFEVRNFRRFLEVIFLHLTSAIRARWGVVVQFSDDFFVSIHIDDIYNFDVWVFDIEQFCDKM